MTVRQGIRHRSSLNVQPMLSNTTRPSRPRIARSNAGALVERIIGRELTDCGHVDLHQARSFVLDRFGYGCSERIGGLYFPERDAGERGELSKIGALQVGVEAAALCCGILDALDYAIAAIVHHDHADVEIL